MKNFYVFHTDNYNMKRIFFLLVFIPFFAFAESMYSPTWGFFLDLPEGYEYTDGDEKNRFSFIGPGEAMFDLVVYSHSFGNYDAITELVGDVNRRIENSGEVDYFQYNDKRAAIIQLNFMNFSGWGLCVELERPAGAGPRPMLLALAYGPAGRSDLELFHISALDSISPSTAERRYPGPLIEYSYPRGEPRRTAIAASGLSAIIRENDAEAAQVLIEREFRILQAYFHSPNWQEAWKRYYRFIYRDSYDRIADAVSVIAQNFGGYTVRSDGEKTAFAQRALSFVQGFAYERDLNGSDFLNLVTTVTEGRGDCDSRAMLWAVLLTSANIRSAIMVSRQYSHAMGLADISGTGARFDFLETRWLVAETTANVNIGLIASDVNDPSHWLGVIFEGDREE
jgi:hypothetical protein